MKIHRKVLPVIAVVLFAVALPLAAFTLIESVPMQQRVRVLPNTSFRTQVQLTQAALCDGSVRLQAGMYSVEIFSMADGSVRGTFFDKSGRKVGEAHGIIAVLRTANTTHALLPAVQRGSNTKTTAPAAGGAPATFASLGLLPTSKSNFNQMGGKMNLEVTSTDGGHAILIGLLLPAVMPAAH